MKKRLLEGVLIVVLIAGLFALTGCGNKQEEKKAENGTAADTSNALVQATEFYIQNAFPNDTTLQGIYATVSNLETWTPNLIEGLQLAPGTRAKIGLGLTATTSSWDFKFVDTEGTEVSVTGVDLSNVLAGNATTLKLTAGDGQIVPVVE